MFTKVDQANQHVYIILKFSETNVFLIIIPLITGDGCAVPALTLLG